MRILIKGAGDLATGIAVRLHSCGYEIVMTDILIPTAVRRTVSFSRAIYENKAVVEGIEAVYAGSMDSGDIADRSVNAMESEIGGRYSDSGDFETYGTCGAAGESGYGGRGDTDCRSADREEFEKRLTKKINEIIRSDRIAVVADKKAETVRLIGPDVIIDAIIAKKNLGTGITDAPLVIGVGPGFTAGVDCHCVIETKRGHYLGKVMYSGSAIPNTGIPGDIGGYTTERIIRAAAAGRFIPVRQIGDRVEAGDIVAKVEEAGSISDVHALIPGIIRGMLQEGVNVYSGMKCGDIDPRCEQEHCCTVSDKARAIGGGALEAVSRFERRRNSIGTVLLAAGEGRRYGSNKLLDIINGRRMFETTVDAAADRGRELFVPDCVIVTGYDEIAGYASAKGIHPVRNDHPELGISESLKLGLSALLKNRTSQNAIDSVLFAVCDQPGLTADSFNRLADGYSASDKGLACMGQGPDLLGNPCIFSKKYFEELMVLTGDRGGKKIIMSHKDDLTVVHATDSELADIDIKPN